AATAPTATAADAGLSAMLPALAPEAVAPASEAAPPTPDRESAALAPAVAAAEVTSAMLDEIAPEALAPASAPAAPTSDRESAASAEDLDTESAALSAALPMLSMPSVSIEDRARSAALAPSPMPEPISSPALPASDSNEEKEASADFETASSARSIALSSDSDTLLPSTSMSMCALPTLPAAIPLIVSQVSQHARSVSHELIKRRLFIRSVPSGWRCTPPTHLPHRRGVNLAPILIPLGLIIDPL